MGGVERRYNSELGLVMAIVDQLANDPPGLFDVHGSTPELLSVDLSIRPPVIVLSFELAVHRHGRRQQQQFRMTVDDDYTMDESPELELQVLMTMIDEHLATSPLGEGVYEI